MHRFKEFWLQSAALERLLVSRKEEQSNFLIVVAFGGSALVFWILLGINSWVHGMPPNWPKFYSVEGMTLATMLLVFFLLVVRFGILAIRLVLSTRRTR